MSDQHPYSPQRFERVRIAAAVGSDGSKLPARTVLIRVLSESDTFLSGIRVDSSGDPVATKTADETQELIAKEAISKQTPLRLNLHYCELEEIPQ